MDTIFNLCNDTTLLYALIIFALTGIGIIALRLISARTGVPTQELQDQMTEINEQAKTQVIEEVRKIRRDPKTGRFMKKEDTDAKD